jgi:DNA helicase-2/ATP-dependent DNA helicase PcrA
VSRAKEKLYLCRAELRAFRGKLTQRVPSRFLVEIPPEMYVLREEKGAPKENVETTKMGAAGLLAALGNLFDKPVSGPSS